MNPDIGEFRVYGRGYMVRWGRDSPWYNQKFNIINLLTNYGSVELYLHKRTSNYILRGRDFVSFMSYFHQF